MRKVQLLPLSPLSRFFCFLRQCVKELALTRGRGVDAELPCLTIDDDRRFGTSLCRFVAEDEMSALPTPSCRGKSLP